MVRMVLLTNKVGCTLETNIYYYMKKILSIVLLVLISSNAYSQSESVFTFSNYHMNVYNPAYVGADEETIITSSLRKQWTGVQYAPETQAVSFGTTLGNNLGFGLSVINDVTFIEKQTFLGADFSYKLQLNRDSNLYFGIRLGGSTFNVNTAGLEAYNVISDPNLSNISAFNPNAGVGILYKREKLYVSLSAPRLLNSYSAKNNDLKANLFSNTPHFYLGTGYNFDLDSSSFFELKPSLLISYVKGAPISFEINTMLDIDDIFEIGMLYRNESTFAAKSIIKVSNRFFFGFAYEISQKELANAGNTNEIFIRFKF